METVKKNGVAVGFDLGNDYSQISFCRANQSMPDTMSLVMGEEQYNIPTLLCRRSNADEASAWCIGKEAQKLSSQGEGQAVGNLLELAQSGGSVELNGKAYSAADLLAIYMRKAFALLSAYVSLDDVCGVAFTLSEMDSDIMESVRAAAEKIGIGGAELYFLSREDCFFQYILHQPEEMWIHEVLLYDYRSDGVMSYTLRMNRQTTPAACFIESELFEEMKLPFDAEKSDEMYKRLDTEFLGIAKKQCDEHNITSVFLLGDSFSREWCKESLRFLCKGRRVFQGNNLFGKGACYGARERIYPSTLSTSYIYLAEDKLVANVGMVCDRGQDEVYFPILDAGTSWYDAKREFDVILAKNNTLTLNIEPVDGGKPRIAKISLEGLNVRGNRTNRVGLKFYMETPDAVQIEITDKGFGEFYASTGKAWRESIPIGEAS